MKEILVHTRYRFLLLTILFFIGYLTIFVSAEETVFNVPSADILEKGKLYLETDQYIRPWKTDSSRAAFFLVRGVYGIGSNTEIGVNTGPFDYIYKNSPFIDATLKWRPFLREYNKGSLGFIVGDNAGIGLENEISGHFRNFAYAAGIFGLTPTMTRITAGSYFATRDVFTSHKRFGAQITFEQPIPNVKGLELAADWFSGDGAAMTTGVIWTVDRYVFYGGYGFANQGRKDDLLTLEMGINF